MNAVYEIVPVIGAIIGAHCRGTSAQQQFLRACLCADWFEARSMVEGMLAEPWLLRGRQEARLREFLEMLPAE